MSPDVTSACRLNDFKSFTQEYAKKTMEEKAAIGCPIFPLEKVALAGSGGGRGPIFQGKGKVECQCVCVCACVCVYVCFQRVFASTTVRHQLMISQYPLTHAKSCGNVVQHAYDHMRVEK